MYVSSTRCGRVVRSAPPGAPYYGPLRVRGVAPAYCVRPALRVVRFSEWYFRDASRFSMVETRPLPPFVYLCRVMKTKHLYIIAGCNGAGKTTASMTLLPKTLRVKEFVNADEIARGLSPFNPEGVAVAAGRLMLERIAFLLREGESFSIETTLATRSYVQLVRVARRQGYFVHLLFFWLETPQLAANRVAERVAKGGHGIPEEVIYRRYYRGLENLFTRFMNEVDAWGIYDNSRFRHERVAIGGRAVSTRVYDKEKFERLRRYVREGS